jgi:hypothetical protein
MSFSRSVEDLLAERGLEVSYETVRPANAGMCSLRPDKKIAALGPAILRVGSDAAFVLLDVD